jgi:hypothetical protein
VQALAFIFFAAAGRLGVKFHQRVSVWLVNLPGDIFSFEKLLAKI